MNNITKYIKNTHQILKRKFAGKKTEDYNPPQSFGILVTSQCNLKCRMCDTGYQGKQKSSLQRNTALDLGFNEKVLTIQQWENIITEMSVLKPGAMVTLSGGEPFLYPDLVDLISVILQCGMKPRVVTNGTLFTKHIPKLAEILDGKSMTLVFSIDGPESVHDSVRGVKGTFQRLITAMDEAALHDSININVTTTINDKNIYLLAETIDMVYKRYSGKIKAYSIYHPWFRTKHMAFLHNQQCHAYPTRPANVEIIDYELIDYGSLWSQLELIHDKWPETKIVPHLNRDQIEQYYKKPSFSLTNRSCEAPFNQMVINPNGTAIVNALCFAGPVGNVMDSSLSEIWNGKKLQSFRSCIKGKIFPGCVRCCGLFISQ